MDSWKDHGWSIMDGLQRKRRLRVSLGAITSTQHPSYRIENNAK
jgi:hypothetical protein